jgi:hypothetical protein
MSVSDPSFVASEHDGTMHLWVIALHAMLLQSPLPRQSDPRGQSAQVPPQSTPLSSPSLNPSVQLVEQVFATQKPLRQSSGVLQARPLLHWVQPPPQSISDSAPFRTPSKQLGTAHTPLAQMPDVQSQPCRQVCQGGQAGHDPPQSLPVSSPFSLPSLQVGVTPASFDPSSPQPTNITATTNSV